MSNHFNRISLRHKKGHCVHIFGRSGEGVYNVGKCHAVCYRVGTVVYAAFREKADSCNKSVSVFYDATLFERIGHLRHTRAHGYLEARIVSLIFGNR